MQSESESSGSGSDIDIEESRRICENATKGPWIIEKNDRFSGDNWLVASCGSCADGKSISVTTDGLRVSQSNGADAEDDGIFIAHAREALPELLGQVEELDLKLQKARERLAWIGTYAHMFCPDHVEETAKKAIQDIFENNK